MRLESCRRIGVKTFTVFVATCFCGVSSKAEEREWTSSDGRAVRGEIQSLDGDTVKLKTAAGIFEMPLTRLSEADQDFAREWSQQSMTTDEGRGADAVGNGGDRTVGDFSNLKLGEWPKDVSADFDIAEIEEVGVDDETGGYIYRSPHFEFHTPDRLSTSVVREFARIFEATFALLNEIPFGLAPKPIGSGDEKGYYLTKLYASESAYAAAGGMPGSGGMFSWNRRGDEYSGVIHIPMQSLGVEHTGVRYIVDHKKQSTTLTHEITHQVMMRWLPMMPTWMSEGFAEVASCQTYSNGRFRLTAVERAVREDVTRRSDSNRDFRMLGVEELMKISHSRWAEMLAAGYGSSNYASANLLLTYFAKLDGDGDGAGLVEFLKAVSSGMDRDQAIDKHLMRGRGFDELQQDVTKAWRSAGLKLTFQ